MKAIILAAGEWTRLRPLTLKTPKAMVEVFGKPLLAHNMDKLIKYVDEFIIVVKYKEEIVRSHFWNNYKWIAISYHRQGEKKWTAAALEWININWDCFVLASDTIFYQNDVERLAKHPWYWVLAKKVDNPEKYGIFQVDAHNILQKVVEKPQRYVWNLASLFCFKLNSDLIKDASRVPASERWEYELTDALNIFCARESVKVLEIQGSYTDITSLEDLERAQDYEALGFWKTRYIEHIWENELHFGISQEHIEKIIDYAADNQDQALQKNTSDSKRFATRETMEKWYTNSGRRVFTLINPNGNLLGISYFRPSLVPEIIEVHNSTLCENLKNTAQSSTGAIRLYPLARGKWLAKDFLKVSERVYRSEFPDTHICVDIEEKNIPSRKCFEGCGYAFVGYGENKKSVANAVHRRRVYMK